VKHCLNTLQPRQRLARRQEYLVAAVYVRRPSFCTRCSVTYFSKLEYVCFHTYPLHSQMSVNTERDVILTSDRSLREAQPEQIDLQLPRSHFETHTTVSSTQVSHPSRVREIEGVIAAAAQCIRDCAAPEQEQPCRKKTRRTGAEIEGRERLSSRSFLARRTASSFGTASWC
jgi:hypothetical protein